MELKKVEVIPKFTKGLSEDLKQLVEQINLCEIGGKYEIKYNTSKECTSAQMRLRRLNNRDIFKFDVDPVKRDCNLYLLITAKKDNTPIVVDDKKSKRK